MNIFVTSNSPIESAIALDDRRVIKMIIETAQLLSTVLHELEISEGLNIYKSTHQNHPCTIWAAESLGNFSWLLQHFEALSAEYKRRFGRDHKSYVTLIEIFSGPALQRLKKKIGNKKQTAFVNCTDFKDVPDVHEAYRQALRKKWLNDKSPPKWTKAKRPEWF
ncbi:MAG: hypothetical protein K0R25_1236 [Rickettsiaceae bacterium]|jgi:hypothetical protein|nr:hypothetical protein [Rickettsiaceae bacterium]